MEIYIIPRLLHQVLKANRQNLMDKKLLLIRIYATSALIVFTFSQVLAQTDFLRNCDSTMVVFCLTQNQASMDNQQLQDIEFYMGYNANKILNSRKEKLFILHYHKPNFVPNYKELAIKVNQVIGLALKYGIPKKRIKFKIQPIMDNNSIEMCGFEGLLLITDEGAF